MRSKTFDEFWQLRLQVTFHEGDPQRWSRRQEKAQWVKSVLKLKPESSVADLGCGDGILDICLSRMGYHVTALDRSRPVIEQARREDDTKRVNFEVQDLRRADFPKHSFDAVILHETLGLMSHDDDLNLLERALTWLKRGGRILTDCPVSPVSQNSWSKEFRDGTLVARTSFNEKTRIHQLDFEFHPQDGEAFILFDPYCPEIRNRTGITRYIYTLPELAGLMESAGFRVQEVPHFYGDTYIGLIGEK